MTTVSKHKKRQLSPVKTCVILLVTVACSVVIVKYAKACFSLSNDGDDPLARRHAMLSMQSLSKRFTKVPEGHEKTFHYDDRVISRPAVRALRSRGWRQVDDEEEAHLIFYYATTPRLFTALKRWQRFNHVPNSGYWNDKADFVKGFKAHEKETGVVPYFLPETYRLASRKERNEFKDRIIQGGGLKFPWVLKEPDVNQGKGIEMVAPNSKRLLEIANWAKPEEEYIIQQYICNENTWNKRKYDVRMFWFVASLDPLVVMYQDGYTRIGNSDYKEDNFDNTRSHLTTHTGLGEEGKASFEEFCDHIIRHAASTHSHLRDPVQHVRNQFKESLAEFIDAFKHLSFSPTKEELTAENGFGFYGADFILDNDLDVWLIEPQKGCGMDEDYDFRIEMHDRLFRGMVDTLEEVWQKQESGKPILPLTNTGKWEVIYANGWKYTYKGYKRSKNKRTCIQPSVA